MFNFFGDTEHNVFDYKPIYYDKEKDEIKRKFASVDGSIDSKKESYVPGAYIKGSLRNGKYQKSRSASTKVQTYIGIVGLILVFVVLIFIAKFYTLL